MPRLPLPSDLSSRPFTTAEAELRGVTRGWLRGPDLSHPFRGVNLPAGVPPTLINRCLALQSRLPAFAFFSGATAARVMAIPLPARLEADFTLHVSVPRPRVAPTGKRIAGHVSSFAEHQIWHDVRVSPPARAWCELARTLDLASLVAAGDYLIHHALPIARRNELDDAMRQWGPRAGAARLREALGLLSERSGSRQESLLRVILVTAGLTNLAVNMPIRTSGGFNYRADLAFLREKLIIEYQSRFHDGTKPFANDMSRKSRLEADEWYVMEVNAQDLENPVELIARIRTVLARRASVSG